MTILAFVWAEKDENQKKYWPKGGEFYFFNFAKLVKEF